MPDNSLSAEPCAYPEAKGRPLSIQNNISYTRNLDGNILGKGGEEGANRHTPGA